jgi:hypothetical protein
MRKNRFPSNVLILFVFSILGISCTVEKAPSNQSILYHKTFRDNQIITHEIWVTSLGEGEAIKLSDTGWYAAYSPDYTQIAYAEFYNEGIWVMNSNGSGA